MWTHRDGIVLKGTALVYDRYLLLLLLPPLVIVSMRITPGVRAGRCLIHPLFLGHSIRHDFRVVCVSL